MSSARDALTFSRGPGKVLIQRRVGPGERRKFIDSRATLSTRASNFINFLVHAILRNSPRREFTSRPRFAIILSSLVHPVVRFLRRGESPSHDTRQTSGRRVSIASRLVQEAGELIYVSRNCGVATASRCILNEIENFTHDVMRYAITRRILSF